MREQAALALVCVFGLLLFAAGVAVGWKLRGSDLSEITETAALPIHHDDGSVTLHRDAAAAPTVAAPTAPGRTIRTVEVVVRPDAVHVPGTADCPAHTVDCPPITVRMDLTRIDDQTHRVTAIAEGGEVAGGIDIPVGHTTIRREYPWAVGVTRSTDELTGLYVSRDFGRLTLNASADEGAGRLGIGWRF